MPSLTFRGDYGASVTLANPRTASLTCDTVQPSNPILVQSAVARIYVSTTAKPFTYKYRVAIDGGYTGDLDYNFASVDNPVYVDVPITVTALDPSFPCKTISTITVSEVGEHGSSTRIRGTVRVIVNYVNVTAPTLPNQIRINGETAINLEALHNATLTWNAGSLGAYDSGLTYRVRRYDVSTGEYTTLGTTTSLTMTITAPNTDSKSYYYYVDCVTAYYVKTNTVYASIYTYIQITVPIISGGGENPVYNPRPMLLVTLGNGPIDGLLTLVADGWTPSRQGYPGDKIYLLRNSAYSGETEDSVTITETDQLMRSVQLTLAVDYAPPEYTNTDIVAGTTIVKAADITELQDALQDIRTAYGMAAYTFTDCVAGETSLTLWSTHIAEIQNCIRSIQSYINAWDVESTTYHVILPTMLTAPGPNAAVINQLRKIVTML